MAIVVKHARVAETPPDPAADVSTADWNDDHVITGDLDIPGFVLPPFESYFTDADTPGYPSAVTNLQGSAGFTSVILSWDLPPEALWRTWEIYEDAAAGFTPTTPVLVTSAQVIVIAHDAGSGPWYFKVRAVNSRGERSTFVEIGPFMMQSVGSIALGIGTVLEENLADLAVRLDGAKVNGQISETQIANGAITTDKIYTDAVTANKILAGEIQAKHIQALAIETDKIAAGAVIGSKIFGGTITGDKIFGGTITAALLTAGTIVASSACIASIDAAKITVGFLDANRIQGRSILGTHIAASQTLSSPNISGGTITGNVITGGSISGTTITGATITGGVIRTAASGSRVEIVASRSAYASFYGPDNQLGGWVESTVAQRLGVYGQSAVYIATANGSALTVGNSWGNTRVDGNLNVTGKINPQTNLISDYSDDGVWIQDRNNLGDRWKIFFASSSKRLYVCNASNVKYYSAVMS